MTLKEAYAAHDYNISVKIKNKERVDTAADFKIREIHYYLDIKDKSGKKMAYSATICNSGNAAYRLDLSDIDIADGYEDFISEKVKLMNKKSLKAHIKSLLNDFPTEKELNAYIGQIVDEIKKRQKSTKVFIKPTLDEIKKYCNEKEYDIDADEFFNYYTANGWKVGKSPMKDWKAALRNWKKREKVFNPQQSSGKTDSMIESTYDIDEINKKAMFNESYDI